MRKDIVSQTQKSLTIVKFNKEPWWKYRLSLKAHKSSVAAVAMSPNKSVFIDAFSISL